MKIVARGWEWEKSEKETAWIAYMCHRCGKIETYPTPRKYGKKCILCRNEILPLCYVRKVKEVKHDQED